MSTFQILLCTNEPQYILGEEGVRTLNPGETWAFSGASGEILCGTVIEPSPGVPNYSAVTQYDGCFDCLSANTESFESNPEYEVCVSCSGNTYTVQTPHPVWTNLYGEPVTQMDAVVLGGVNGLNS